MAPISMGRDRRAMTRKSECPRIATKATDLQSESRSRSERDESRYSSHRKRDFKSDRRKARSPSSDNAEDCVSLRGLSRREGSRPRSREGSRSRSRDRVSTFQERRSFVRSTKPNSDVLAMLIKDQVRTNDRMDRVELEKATIAFEKVDASGRQVSVCQMFFDVTVFAGETND